MVRDGYFYGLVFLLVAIVVYMLTGGWLWASSQFSWHSSSCGFSAILNAPFPKGTALSFRPPIGLVTEVASFETPSGPRQRISIFLNVFNVHVNRSPISGILRDVHYQKGKYLNAMNPASAEQNEQMPWPRSPGRGSRSPSSRLQDCWPAASFSCPRPATASAGDRVGLIKFGSRVDVILPAVCKIVVTKGTR